MELAVHQVERSHPALVRPRCPRQLAADSADEPKDAHQALHCAARNGRTFSLSWVQTLSAP
jgi:hypothetical protein